MLRAAARSTAIISRKASTQPGRRLISRSSRPSRPSRAKARASAVRPARASARTSRARSAGAGPPAAGLGGRQGQQAASPRTSGRRRRQLQRQQARRGGSRRAEVEGGEGGARAWADRAAQAARIRRRGLGAGAWLGSAAAPRSPADRASAGRLCRRRGDGPRPAGPGRGVPAPGDVAGEAGRGSPGRWRRRRRPGSGRGEQHRRRSAAPWPGPAGRCAGATSARDGLEVGGALGPLQQAMSPPRPWRRAAGGLAQGRSLGATAGPAQAGIGERRRARGRGDRLERRDRAYVDAGRPARRCRARGGGGEHGVMAVDGRRPRHAAAIGEGGGARPAPIQPAWQKARSRSRRRAGCRRASPMRRPCADRSAPPSARLRRRRRWPSGLGQDRRSAGRRRRWPARAWQ